MTANDIRKLANQRRADTLTMIYQANTGHTGGSLSVLDILSVLYYDVLQIRPGQPDWPDRDRFLLSKGHSVEGFLALLADRGFFPAQELNTFSKPGSRLIGHPSVKVPGMEMSTGALGHGLSIGVGIAIAAKRSEATYKTYVVMGDGEQDEGSVWEAAMAGANYKLDNLFAIIDRNGLQISGPTEQVMELSDLAAKWRAFGWDVKEADGHDIEALLHYFHTQKQEGKPHCLIAKTIKAKGLPCGENKPEWHHKVPTLDQLQEAYEALGVKGVSWA